MVWVTKISGKSGDEYFKKIERNEDGKRGTQDVF